METNFHFNISTTSGTYEFNVLTEGKDYKLTDIKEKDLSSILQLFKQAEIKSSFSIDTIVDRLRLLPGVLDVQMTTASKTNTISIPTILQQPAQQIPLADIASNIANTLETTCPDGAGSMVMISRPGEDSQFVSAGTSSVGGLNLNGQTAALIGSGSKIFTSLCCMALVNRGALTLDTKISDVFSKKQMLIFDDQDKAKDLTLGMLLSHTSGLLCFADDDRDNRVGMSLSHILDAKEPGSVKFYGHPGDQIYSYSNHIGLAAAMLEIAFKKPYFEILKEELLTPLGMNRTSYDCPQDNVLLGYKIEKEGSPFSAKEEVTDPMMQGAGGLWSCMDDIEKLGTALGLALSNKLDLTGPEGHVIISAEHLQSMMQPQTINGHCGFAFDLEEDAVGKGGGIRGYDFKFKVDTKSGCCVSTMCNHAGKGKFREYLGITSYALRIMNPGIQIPQSSNTSLVSNMEVNELPIEACSERFKGFAGLLAFPKTRPLESINFNGTTLPLKEQKLPDQEKGLIESYLIIGNSPFQGTELLIYERNEHLYPCLSKGLEVWSFGQTIAAKFPIVTAEEIVQKFKSASGDYIDTLTGGPPPRQIRVDPEMGLTLNFLGSSPAKCLITALSDNEVSFVACLNGAPQACSYKLVKKDMSDWSLVILNAETEDVITNLPQTKIQLTDYI